MQRGILGHGEGSPEDDGTTEETRTRSAGQKTARDDVTFAPRGNRTAVTEGGTPRPQGTRWHSPGRETDFCNGSF